MTEAECIAALIEGGLPRLRAGTLRFWGEWFGKPYDNVHRIVGCAAEADLLTIRFNGDEVLRVWSPRGCVANDLSFEIADADRVRWEWFYYGRARAPENLYFEDFVRTSGGFIASSNVDWYDPRLNPSGEHLAVEIL